MDYRKITDIEVSGIDPNDYPDFCDAHISSAYYEDRPMTDDELDTLNEDYDFVYEQILKHIF
jgi:hypothetical protein